MELTTRLFHVPGAGRLSDDFPLAALAEHVR
jgi:hypothetical protein